MTELVSRTVLPVIPYIRVLATPWNCQSPSATLLLLWSLLPSLVIPHTCVGICPTLLTPAEKHTPYGSILYFPSNSSLSPKLRKSEALLFTFAAFYSWALVLKTQKPNEAPLSLLLVNTSSPWVSKTTNNELCLVGSEAADGLRCNDTVLFCTHTYVSSSLQITQR